MTENQLKYLAYQESLRHNAATEADAMRKTDEMVRSNLANEDVKRGELTEAQRANTAREQENYRANTAKENLTQQQLIESQRHNVEQENLGWARHTADTILGTANAAAKWIDAFTPG